MMIGHPSSSIRGWSLLVALFPLFCHKTSEAQTFPTPAPTMACPNEMAAWAQCIVGIGLDAQACAECYFSYRDSITDQTTCGELTSLICTQIETCAGTCGTSCGSLVEALGTCVFGPICGDVSCSASAPTPTAAATTSTPSSPAAPVTPAPAPSPTFGTPAPSVDPCQAENDVMSDCVRSSGVSIDACNACLEEYAAGTIDTCEESVSYTCGAMKACSECGDCEEEFVTLSNCFVEGACDTIVCPASAPATSPTLGVIASPTASPVATPASGPPSPTAAGAGGGPADEPCPSELDGFQDCVTTEISSADAASCGACVAAALDGFTAVARQAPTCSAVSGALCPAVEGEGGCGACGTCADELRLYMECTADALTAGCGLDCPSSTSGAPSNRRLLATVAAGMAVAAAGLV